MKTVEMTLGGKEINTEGGFELSADQIDFTKSVEVLKIREGDVIVLKTDRVLKAEQIERLKNDVFAALQKFKPGQVIVLENLEIGVVRAE